MLLVYLGSVEYLTFIYYFLFFIYFFFGGGVRGIVFVRSEMLLVLYMVWPSILFSAGQILSVGNLLIATNGILPTVHGHAFSDVTLAIQSANIWIQVSSEVINMCC